MSATDAVCHTGNGTTTTNKAIHYISGLRPYRGGLCGPIHYHPRTSASATEEVAVRTYMFHNPCSASRNAWYWGLIRTVS